MRVIRRVHQHVIAEKIGDHLSHLLALMNHNARKEAAADHVLAELMLDILGNRAFANVNRLIIHPARPKGKPAETGFENAKTNIRVAVQDTGAKERRNRSHCTPRMGCQPADEPIVPKVAITGEAKRKAVMNDTEAFFVGGSPDWLEVGVVQWLVEREPGLYPYGPRTAAPFSDLFHGILDPQA